MQLRRSLLALVALAISATSLPAVAAVGDADGCRDITFARVGYEPNRYQDQGLTIGGIDPSDRDDTWVYTGGGILRVEQVELAAPACRSVTYSVYVYADTLDEDGQPILLGVRPLTGEGPRPTVLGYDSSADPESPIGDEYFEPCVRVVLETAALGSGKVFDRAPDDDSDDRFPRICVPEQARTWN